MDTTGANIPYKETMELEVFPDAVFGVSEIWVGMLRLWHDELEICGVSETRGS